MPKGKGRKYLPKNLTLKERRSPSLRKKLSRCIKTVEKTACPKSAKKNGAYNYKQCSYSPVAVCRSSLTKKRYP